nr:hypothetical protein [Tanacetum cinerariifolium]
MNDDSGKIKSENDEDDLTHPNLSTYKVDGEEEENEKADDDEVSSDQRVYSPLDHELTEEEKKIKRMMMRIWRVNWNKTKKMICTEIQTNKFAKAISSISGVVDNYLASKMKEAVDVVVQLQTNKLREESQAKNQKFLNQVDSTMRTIIKEQVQAQVSKIMPKIENSSFTLRIQIKEDSHWQNRGKPISQQIRHSKEFYNALVESYNSDKDIFSSYGDVFTLKRGRDDQNKDEDPSVGSNRGSKRRRSSKEAESSKEPTHKESKSTSSLKDTSRSQPKSSGKSAHAEKHGQKVDDLEDQSHQEFNTGNDDETSVREALYTVDNRPPQPWITQMAQAVGTQSLFNEFLDTPINFFAFIINRLKIDNLTQEILTDPTYDLIKGTYKSVVELEYHLEEVFKATNDHLDWHNSEGKPYPHDFSRSSSQKYTTSITKTKATDYGHVKWIEDNVSRIWSSVKVVYDKHAYWGTYHWGPIMKYFGYRHLEEIIVRRQDNQLYKFRECDFKRLRRQDIEDIDGTLNHVRTALNDIAIGIEMDYFPKRKWSKQDKKRARVMINAIDRNLKDRRLMRNLEKFVGGRPYRGDLRLMERTI